MAMKRCPDCGEKYSDTYKYCPFCEEEDALREGERLRRSTNGGRRSASRASRRSSYSLVTPTLIVLILVMSALLVYLLFGEKIADKFRDDTPDNPSVSEQQPVSPPDSSSPASSGATSSTPGTMPEDPSLTTPEVSYEAVYSLPSGLKLNKTDYTTSVGDADVQLKVSGDDGTRDYTWVSQNPSVASVDSNGKVTALSSGTINILVSDGNRKGACIVRVKGGSASTPQTPAQTPTNAKLNLTDFTMSVGEMDVLLTVQGVTSGITWTSSNTSVATVNKGLVHAVGSGRCTVTASFGGSELECIVRVR